MPIGTISAVLAGGKLIGDLVSGFQEEAAKEEYFKNQNKAIDTAIGQYIDAKDRTELKTSDNVNDLTNLAIVSKDKTLTNSLITQSAQLRSNEMTALNSIDNAIASLQSQRPGEYEGKSGIGIVAGAVASAAMSGASIQAMIDGMDSKKISTIDDGPDNSTIDSILPTENLTPSGNLGDAGKEGVMFTAPVSDIFLEQLLNKEW